ncbi:MAG: hypothetical protein K940chlam1_01183 [Candidatus Anoxychlamydiales bacterium]|nr:hypothetical protein [Candidatus Anoxychlamydiales bacterium]NGX35395.1 hypothetical protein [Candidatus Anoxychlamydiales bacterium]
MKNVCLKLFAYEKQKHKGILIYEWLLKLAKKNDIAGGNVFRAIAGYGHKGVIHEDRFYELAGNVPIKISFITDREKATSFINLLKEEKLNLFYEISEIEYGRIDDHKE